MASKPLPEGFMAAPFKTRRWGPILERILSHGEVSVRLLHGGYGAGKLVYLVMVFEGTLLTLVGSH